MARWSTEFGAEGGLFRRLRDACAAECEKHDHEHCKLCAQMCRECAEDCRKAAASITPA